MNKLRKILILSLFMVLVSFSYAQEKVIHGVVTTFETIPVVGAEIVVKSSEQVVKTDTLGRFSVEVSGKDKLKVKANGFNTTNVKLNEKTKVVSVNLKLKPGEKGKAYAIGYGHVLDEEKLNAVAQVNNNDVDFSTCRTMQEAIAGRIPGVQFQGGGIIIRGNASISGPTYALIVIDGVTSEASALDRMNPSDVKSISVIKDGSSAIYGAKGANGVVVIETKTGRDN
jgi:TonB-dependent SusC/RagA subfamily outer membrane receptor